jgi:DNA-binding LacI/PurR family transcriptional regulator
MPKPAATIYDVAEKAGVSIATVSRVVNDPRKVNEATRSTVLKAIEQLGFVPKAEARARAMNGTRRISIITPFLTAPAYVQRLRGVATALAKQNYELIIHTVDSLDQLNSYLGTLPLTHRFDGLILLSLKIDAKLAGRLAKQGVETVLIEYAQPNLNSIEIDDLAGGRLVADYVLKKGHRRCAFVGDTGIPDYIVYPASQRLLGFRQVLANAGVSLSEGNIYLGPYDMENTRQQVKAMLSRAEPPTAIFAATDLQAMGVLKAARDLNLKVPQDIAVVGFDDLDMADYIGLTTVCQHLEESGRIAVELLLSRLADPSRPAQHIHLPLALIERETA